MAMAVELDEKFNDNPSTSSQQSSSSSVPSQQQDILDHLINNEQICFKSQQRNETDLTKQQKINIALEIFDNSRLNFLLRFGSYLNRDHLDFFKQLLNNETETESIEIDLVLKDLYKTFEINERVRIKNRRYRALKQLINEGAYFTETEMMKRNPLLYEQLIGQYLSDDEKKFRDRSTITDQPTLVKLLLEGIERDNAEDRRKREQYYEDEEMGDDDDDDDDDNSVIYTKWGEFQEEPSKTSHTKSSKTITSEEQALLKDEFISTMYQDFLDGKDVDFDYNNVDENRDYDDLEMSGYDEEEKYFDAEEAEMQTIQENREDEEDELDVFMNNLNSSLAIGDLTRNMEKLGKHQ